MQSPKFIVLRGPSGSGKSTTAKILHREAQQPIAFIEQDYFRETLFRHDDETRDIRRDLMTQNAIAILNAGIDVILEGILNRETYQRVFDEVIAAHPDNNFFFYFDVSFEETVRRHETREKSKLFDAEEMRPWYELAGPSGHPAEITIPESNTLEQTLATVRKVTGL